ncbi:hypothetical protein C8R45DRAFT_953050 [Mycena sanguinolenta]|nr:hypothetical protein C8R45DRAFT_953050 [Mycena sanguinolenta]
MPLSIVWATQLSCLQPAPFDVDILLYGLGGSCTGVPYFTGSHNIFQPTWWNSTASKQPAADDRAQDRVIYCSLSVSHPIDGRIPRAGHAVYNLN